MVMKTKLAKVGIVFFLFVGMTTNAQEFNEGIGESGQLITANSDILYNITTVVDKNGSISRGFLVGLKSDTLVVHRDQESYKYPLKELINVSIEIERSNYKGLLLGGILGIYLGNVALLKAENQSSNYMEDTGIGPILLWSLLCGFAGGGIGYLFEKSSSDDKEVFAFSDNPNSWADEFNRLKVFIRGDKPRKLYHIMVQLSQVSTRYSNLDIDREMYYYEVTSFNLLRKLDFTYSFFNKMNLGGSICWFGEPSFEYWGYTPFYDFDGDVRQKYYGVGYYAVASYQPLKKEFSKTISWKIGLGLGVGKIDYALTVSKTIFTGEEYITESNETKIKKNSFSSILYTNLDFYLYEGLSIGLAADYVYLPETMPAIPELNLESKSLGNYSIGLAFSLHF